MNPVVQRSLLAHIGTKESAASQKTISLISNIPPVNLHRSYREQIGAPNLRTGWTLTIVTFSFRAELENGLFGEEAPGTKSTIPEYDLPLEVKLLSSGNPVLVDYFNIFHQKEEKEQEFGAKKLPEIVKKTLVLELFAPITVVGGQNLEIELRLEDKSTPKIAGWSEGLRYFLKMLEPEVNVTYNQIYPNS